MVQVTEELLEWQALVTVVQMVVPHTDAKAASDAGRWRLRVSLDEHEGDDDVVAPTDGGTRAWARARGCGTDGRGEARELALIASVSSVHLITCAVVRLVRRL